MSHHTFFPASPPGKKWVKSNKEKLRLHAHSLHSPMIPHWTDFIKYVKFAISHDFKKFKEHKHLQHKSSAQQCCSTALIPSYPVDLLIVHSYLTGPCISCSPLPLAFGGPDLQVGGVFVTPRPNWLSWRQTHMKGLWYPMVHRCCCQCRVLNHAGKASGRKSCLCDCPSLDTGSPLPHYTSKRSRRY